MDVECLRKIILFINEFSWVQIRKAEISDSKNENQFFVPRNLGLYMSDLWREIYKPVLKLEFTAHGVNGVPLRIWTLRPNTKSLTEG